MTLQNPLQDLGPLPGQQSRVGKRVLVSYFLLSSFVLKAQGSSYQRRKSMLGKSQLPPKHPIVYILVSLPVSTFFSPTTTASSALHLSHT
jgi:hypothetical protein